MQFVISVALLAFMIVSVVDVIRRADDEIRYLPKIAWVLIVLLFSPIGAALWWGLGRQYAGPLNIRMPQRRPRPQPQSGSSPVWVPPAAGDSRSTEEQIAALDREIEEWRLREELEKRRKDGNQPPNDLGE